MLVELRACLRVNFCFQDTSLLLISLSEKEVENHC